MNNLKKGRWNDILPNMYICMCVCITKKDWILFFIAKVHNSPTFSKLPLFMHSAQNFVAKLLYLYLYFSCKPRVRM